MEISRREMIKKSLLTLSAIIIGNNILESKNLKLLSEASVSEPQNRQRILRKAKFIEHNCVIFKDAEAYKKLKKREKKSFKFTECNNCVAVCPRKAISVKSIEARNESLLPVLDEQGCIGCGRCVKVCPQEPKAWEIWDITNNKKLM